MLVSDRRYIWHPFTPLAEKADPLLVTSAEGIYLTTHDGREVIDAVSSWWVNLHGHSHPVIAKAIADQARQLEHVMFAGFTHPPAISLAKNLFDILPVDPGRIFFSDNGSTAVEVALKMAIQYWHIRGLKKHKILALSGAYHGDTFGAMAVGERGLFTRPFFPFLFDVVFIDFPTEKNYEQVYRDFVAHIDTGEVACFIFEPLVQAAGGMRMYRPDHLDALMEYAANKEVLCIADEVFTGFGRTGKLFACDHLRRRPDLMALSKGLTGGALPMGVTACTSKVLEVFDSREYSRTFFHGHSFTANPVACAAANASYQLLIQPACQANIDRITVSHKTFVERIKDHERVRAARTLGTILAIEVEAGQTGYENDIARTIYSYFLERNILLRPLGNVIYFLPPYIIREEECRLVYNCIEDFLDQL